MKIFSRYLLDQLPMYQDQILAVSLDKKNRDLFVKAIDENDSVNLSQAEVEQLIDFLSNLFMKEGLQGDSEPNKYGLFLDSLVGELNRVDRERQKKI